MSRSIRVSRSGHDSKNSFCTNAVLPFTVLLFVIAALVAITPPTPASAQVAPVNPDPISSPIEPPTAPVAANPAEPGPASQGGGIASPSGPQGPQGTPGPGGEAGGSASINLDLDEALDRPSQSIVVILLITVLSVAPALLIMLTSFTRIVIVLTLTRNAIGVMTIPPNQVLVGLALFLSFFIMSPTLSAMNDQAVQPYLRGELTQSAAFTAGTKPLRSFMLKNTRQGELALFASVAEKERPDRPEDVGLNALIPAFILSEIKTAFIIGFVIFIPFLVIDIIVSSSLMSMGMMMLPPQMISLPFKLLLFVLVDGWALVVRSLLSSFVT